MDKLLERHKLPKPTQEELGNLNSIILIEESELKTFSQRKFLFGFLEMQPRVLHTLGNCCTAELHTQIPNKENSEAQILMVNSTKHLGKKEY